MESDRMPSYVHKVADVMLLDSKEDYYTSFASKHQVVPYKKLVVPSAMRSIYWKCYGFPATENNEILTRNKIVCLLCKSQMIYNRNTSNLRMHLQNKHKHELEALELVQPMPSCKSGRTDRRSARRGCKVRRRDQDAMQMCPVTSQNEESVEITESNLPHYLSDLDETTFAIDGKYIADTIAEFVIMDLQSPDIVEGKGFQRLVATLKSPCEIPSKSRLTEEFIPKIYDSVKEQLGPEISIINFEISLSVEDWVSSSGDTYSTVSMHYAQMDDGELQTKILSSIYCSDMDALHWGVQFDSVIEEWDIKVSRVKAIIVSSNRDEVYDSLIARSYTIVPCLGHTIQAACMEACFYKPEVDLIVKKCRTLIALVNLNPACNNFLREQEGLIECEKGGLQPDTPPLWSSTFTMLEQLLVRKDILPKIYITLSNAGYSVDSIQFSTDEWSIIADITEVLSPFKVAMTTLYEERIPLISILKPLLQQLKNVHLEKNKFDSKFALELKSVLCTLIMNKYNDPRINEILDMSCALDPRFKNLPFMNDKCKDRLKDKLKEMINNVAQATSGFRDTVSSPSKRSRLSGMEYLLGDLCVKNDVPSAQRIHLEVVQFECEPPITLDKSPIQYWKNNQGKFPNISKLALQFLCIPVCVNNYLNSHFNFKTSNSILTPQLVHKLRFSHQNNVTL
ncbi:unnamed protein product [Nezara viridula]|uniref:BED-type domain-containing protein n=1 Tax=Nezara viridula TaxID=85310 RepID=A0A9P0HRD5_NEZVI|nr:unnamed protein product [Nezara viridula]